MVIPRPLPATHPPLLPSPFPRPSPSSLSLISPRIKVTSLSLHPSTCTPPRSGLSAAHSRQCQAEIILSVKLSNEARYTHALENKHSLELWESTFAFEERWGVVARIKWMNEKECFVFMPQFMESVSSDIWGLRVNTNVCSLLIYYKCNFPFSGNTFIKPKDGDVILIVTQTSFPKQGYWKQAYQVLNVSSREELC